MLEQLCFHDYERNVLADSVLEKFATRVGGHFNETKAAAFRPWSWMENNRKRLVVCSMYPICSSSWVVTDAIVSIGIRERCRPCERYGADPSYWFITHIRPV